MQKECMEQQKEKIYELAMFFSRMWGVAETLEPFPNLEFKEVRDKMVEWAMECIACQEEDFIEFFQKKMKMEIERSP